MALTHQQGVGQNDTSYWAGFKDRDLVVRLKRKREEFLEAFDQSLYFQRVHRNWSYYHGLNFPSGHGRTEIRIGGEEGELRLMAINEFRSNLSLLKTYIIEGDIEWDAIANGESAAALNAARKANKLLDGAVQSRVLDVDSVLDRTVEDALVLTAGYSWILWDKNHGEPLRVEYTPTGKVKRIIYKGMPRLLNPSLFDVTFDFSQRVFKESQWVECRRQENRWDLAAEFPDKKEAILKTPSTQEADRKYLKFDFRLTAEESTSRDHRWVSYFYHLPTPALPSGRFMRRLDEIVLENEWALPDGHIPCHRLIPARFMLTPFGFTQGFGAQAPQEALNASVSTRVTAENALGFPKVWKKKGEPLNRAQLEPGITLLETETKPEVLQFMELSPEIEKGTRLYMEFVERAFGTNETARGNPESNVKAAAAMAFTEQRVTQAASELVKNRRRHLEDFGTSFVKVYAARMGPDDARTINVRSSDTERAQTVGFTAEELKQIESVGVIPGNPALRTLGGRIQVAEILLERQAVSPDEFVTVLKTGKLDRLTEAEDNQLQLIGEENDGLFSGTGQHFAQPHHNHMLHIRRHLAQADGEAARRNPELGNRFRAAALQHKEFLTFVDPTPIMDPVTGLVDQEATQQQLQKAEIVNQSVEFNKMLGYLPPTFIPFGMPQPQGGPAPQEPLETTAMGTPPAAAPGPEPGPPSGGQPQQQLGGGPRMTGVADAVLGRIEQGAA